MKSFTITTLLLALIVGAAAAFFRPAVPHQVETKPLFIPRGGAQSAFDAGLDNPDVAVDENISPARKCGFCMG